MKSDKLFYTLNMVPMVTHVLSRCAIKCAWLVAYGVRHIIVVVSILL